MTETTGNASGENILKTCLIETLKYFQIKVKQKLNGFNGWTLGHFIQILNGKLVELWNILTKNLMGYWLKSGKFYPKMKFDIG